MPYYLDNQFLLEQPLDHRGWLRRHRRLRRRGSLPPLPGPRRHRRPGGPRPGGTPQPAPPEFLSRRRGGVQEQGPGRPAGESLQPARGLLGLSLPRGGPPPGEPLPRHLLPRRPDHRLRRQRRRPPGHGRVPAGRPLPLAHRRRQRHQLGPGPGWQCLRAGGPGGTSPSPATPATWPRRPRCNAPTC